MDPEEFRQRFCSVLHRLQTSTDEKDSVSKIAEGLWELNKLLYVTTAETRSDFISDYHEFWSEHCSEVLGMEINREKCLDVAKRLEDLFVHHGDRLRPTIDPELNLTPHAIANARFFSAAQDFSLKIDEKPYSIAAN